MKLLKYSIPLVTLLFFVGCDAQTVLECTERIADDIQLVVMDAKTGEDITASAFISGSGEISLNNDSGEWLISSVDKPGLISVTHNGYNEQALFLDLCLTDSEIIIELIPS